MSEGTPATKLVERKGQVEQVRRLLEEVAQRSPSVKPILNLYGIPGIGKTAVTRQLYEHFARDHNVVMLGFDKAELTRAVGEVPSRPRPCSWQEVIQELKQLPILEEHLADDVPADAPGWGALCESSLAGDTTLPVLLLLDGLDDLPIWSWLQSEVITPLLEDDERGAVIVCTSQAPLYWHFWELRERCQAFELQPFSPEETEAWVDENLPERKPLNGLIFNFTQGYPLALRGVLDACLEEQRDRERDEQELPVPLDELDPIARLVVRGVGVMRRLDMPVIRELLCGNHEPLEDQPTEEKRELPYFSREEERKLRQLSPDAIGMNKVVHELRVQGYVKQYRQDQLEQFLPSVRALIKQKMQQVTTDDPWHYAQVCQRIAALYYKQAQERPADEPEAFVDWLYFSTELFDHYSSASYRRSWDRQLKKLFERAEEVIKRMLARSPQVEFPLIITFYRNEELIKKLRALSKNEVTAGIFESVDQQMQGLILKMQQTLQQSSEDNSSYSAALWMLPDFENWTLPEFKASRQKVVEQFLQRLPTDKLPQDIQDPALFRSSVKKFLIEPEEFSIQELRRKFKETELPLTDKEIDNLVTLVFNSRGLLSYARADRTYQFEQLVKGLFTKDDSVALANQV